MYKFIKKTHNNIRRIAMKNLLEYVKSRSKDLDDIFIRRLCVDNNEINLVYNEALVDSTMISNFVVRSIVECIREEKVLNEIDFIKQLIRG